MCLCCVVCSTEISLNVLCCVQHRDLSECVCVVCSTEISLNVFVLCCVQHRDLSECVCVVLCAARRSL